MTAAAGKNSATLWRQREMTEELEEEGKTIGGSCLEKKHTVPAAPAGGFKESSNSCSDEIQGQEIRTSPGHGRSVLVLIELRRKLRNF